MGKEISIKQPQDIEKKNTENEVISNNFRKLISEIVLEIIIKRKKNGCHWIYKDK